MLDPSSPPSSVLFHYILHCGYPFLQWVVTFLAIRVVEDHLLDIREGLFRVGDFLAHAPIHRWQVRRIAPVMVDGDDKVVQVLDKVVPIGRPGAKPNQPRAWVGLPIRRTRI